MSEQDGNRPMFTDADLTHPWATQYRIPIVKNPYPTWKYEVALVVPDPDDGFAGTLWGAIWPDEDEAQLIGHVIDFRMQWYYPHWQKQMRERALDVDSGTNTVILLKHRDWGWTYRKATWDHGVWPHFKIARRFDTLASLLDHIFDHHRDWPAWAAKAPTRSAMS